MQAAYDAITKGDTGPQMGGQPGGGYGYGQQGYYQGSTTWSNVQKYCFLLLIWHFYKIKMYKMMFFHYHRE